MVKKLNRVTLVCDGLTTSLNIPKKEEPFIAETIDVYLDESEEYKVPQNLVKVTDEVILDFVNRLGMNEDILNFILELEKKCKNGVKLRFDYTSEFTQSDWDLIIENVVNNPRLKFGEYHFIIWDEKDITFNLDTDRKLDITKSGNGILTLRGKMGDVRYYGDIEKLKVDGKFKDIVGFDGNSIVTQLFDYDSLPDLYESLNERLRRLTSH